MTRGPRAAPPARVDLHLHSTASDGTLTPAAVVRRAAEAGLAGLSLTDHDTTAGIDEARGEAQRRGVAFVVGAELSANEPGSSVHLLAYGFDSADGNLQAFFTRYDEDRRARGRAMVDRLRAEGVELSYEDVEAQHGDAAPTRAHVARALVAGAHVSREEEAFERYLSRGGPAFVEKREVVPAEVFEVVHRAGGVVLLAHPGRMFGPRRVRRWAAEGLDGIEVFHPANSAATRSRLRALVKELGLLESGGSDFHGPGTRRSELGTEPVPARWMEEILERCRG